MKIEVQAGVMWGESSKHEESCGPTWRSSQVRANIICRTQLLGPNDNPTITEPTACQTHVNQHARSHWLWLPYVAIAKLRRFYRKASNTISGEHFFHHRWLKPGIPGPAVFCHLSGSRHLQAALGWRRSGQGKGKNKNCLELGFTFFWKSIARLQNIPKFKDNPLDFTRHFLANCSGPVQCLSTLASKSSIRWRPNDLRIHQLLSDAEPWWCRTSNASK